MSPWRPILLVYLSLLSCSSPQLDFGDATSADSNNSEFVGTVTEIERHDTHYEIRGSLTRTQAREHNLVLSVQQPLNSLATSRATTSAFSIPISFAQVRDHGGLPFEIEVQYADGNFAVDTGGLLLPLFSLADMYHLEGSPSILRIPAGRKVVISESVTTELIDVQGSLECGHQTSATVTTEGILIRTGGSLHCGSSDAPFAGNVSFVLTHEKDIRLAGSNPTPAGAPVTKAIMVAAGGELELFGRSRTKAAELAADANVGETELHFKESVNWTIGDSIVVATTGFSPYENETRQITDVSSDRKSVSLDSALNYFHFGQDQTLSNSAAKSWSVHENGLVINLSRNIRISAPSSESDVDQLGAHIMVMRNAVAHVDSVEIFNAGQMGILARYPFHWHRVGEAPGQFIKNSSIHHSYSRCVTIHSTHQTTVADNVCFDHFGHGYFLEEGNETKNTIRGNIGVLTRRVAPERALLASDFKGIVQRFPGPSTFWISNPDNTVTDNIAIGSEGSGFWMAFVSHLLCDDTTGCQVLNSHHEDDIHPIETPTLAFDRNRASSSVMGITWDGAPTGPLTNNPRQPLDRELVSAHYKPTLTPTFNDLEANKNITALYFRGELAMFENMVMADNHVAAFLAYNQALIDTLIAAKTANSSTHEDSYLLNPTASSSAVRFRWSDALVNAGIHMYDGPFILDGVHFANFDTAQHIVEVNGQERDITSMPIKITGGAGKFDNVVRDISATPIPFQNFTFAIDAAPPTWIPVDGWQDRYTTALADEQGLLSGSPGLLRPDHPMNWDDETCVRLPTGDALRCTYKLGQIRILGGVSNKKRFIAEREKGTEIVSSTFAPVGTWLHNKFSLIVDQGYGYTIRNLDFRDYVEVANGPPLMPPLSQLNFQYFATELLPSPIIRIASPVACDTSDISLVEGGVGFAPKLGSMSALLTSTVSATYFDGADLYARIFPTKSKVTYDNINQLSFNGLLRCN